MNSQNPSHYREHTRQQDGWTVLAPQPEPEQPPPYTPEAAAGPAPSAHTPVLLTFEIPTNSNIIGATPVTRSKRYGRDAPFAAGYIEICGVMGLDPATACLGYKWDKDSGNVPTHQLATANDWDRCLEDGIGMTARARTRRVACLIRNLNLAQETAPVATTVVGSKRKSSRTSGRSTEEKHTFDFTKEHRELKAHLACATHKGELCFVSNADGTHHRVDPYHVSLWAKEISVGNATSARPPENIMFQEFFLPAAKRARTTRPGPGSSTNPCAPTIHVTVNTGTNGNDIKSSPPRRSPLGTITAANANANNVDIPTSHYRSPSHALSNAGDENSGSDIIRYPPVTEILQLIDNSQIFEGSAVLTFPAVIFADALHEFQITRVDQVPLLDTDFYVEQVNMPAGLAELFVEESIAALGRAQKGKLAM